MPTKNYSHLMGDISDLLAEIKDLSNKVGPQEVKIAYLLDENERLLAKLKEIIDKTRSMTIINTMTDKGSHSTRLIEIRDYLDAIKAELEAENE